MQIAVIESNKNVVGLLTMYMSMYEGISVECLDGGKQAMDYLLARKPYETRPPVDLLLLDISFACGSDAQFFKDFREAQSLKDIPAVVLANNSTVQQQAQCRQLGVSSVIAKPTSVKGFKALVDQLVQFEFPRLVPVCA